LQNTELLRQEQHNLSDHPKLKLRTTDGNPLASPPPTKNRWSQLIEKMEIVRERGDIKSALEGLRNIREEAVEEADLESAGLATAHIVVCHKHLYQNTGCQSHLLQMEAELQRGMTLEVADSLKVVFWMRLADLECERSNFEQAEFLCQHACDVVAKGGPSEAEVLNRLAHVKARSGKLADAEALFVRAAAIMAEDRGRRTFRQVTLRSGIHARRALLAVAQRRYWSAIAHLATGYLLAWEYRIRFGMPNRLRQYHRPIGRIIRSMFTFERPH
jgi:hypothetical protein